MKKQIVLITLARIVLVLLGTGMLYVVVQPTYNFAHWIPHNGLDYMGVPYSTQLWLEQHADVGLHFFGAITLYWLFYYSLGARRGADSKISFGFVIALCLGAEIAQSTIGRGFSGGDLLLGFCGAFVAYLSHYVTATQSERGG